MSNREKVYVLLFLVIFFSGMAAFVAPPFTIPLAVSLGTLVYLSVDRQ